MQTAVANRREDNNVSKPPADRSRERRDREGPDRVGRDDDGLGTGVRRTAPKLTFGTGQTSFIFVAFNCAAFGAFFVFCLLRRAAFRLA